MGLFEEACDEAYDAEIQIEEGNQKKKSGLNVASAIIKDVGGITVATKCFNTFFDLAAKLFPENKKYQGAISLAQKAVPAAIAGYQIYESVKKYYKEDEKPKSASRYFNEKIANIIDITDHTCVKFNHGCMNDDVTNWILTLPDAENFKVLEIYDDNLEKSTVTKDYGRVYLLCEIEQKYKIVIVIRLMGKTISYTGFHYNSELDVESYDNTIATEYFKSLNCEENLIVINTFGITTIPRKTIDFNVYQFDDTIKDEIKNAIKKNVKRGYAFIGPPGTGKTTIVQKVIDDIRDIPVIYLSLKELSYIHDLKRAFTFVKSIGQSIIILEDMDVLKLKQKGSDHLAVFIEEMDAVKCTGGNIFIGTLNEPESVHPSLINRRGRFDKVEFIDSPHCKKEILEVIQNKYKSLTNEEYTYDLTEVFYDKFTKLKLNQADISELLNSILLKDEEPTERMMLNALKEIEKTKKILKENMIDLEK